MSDLNREVLELVWGKQASSSGVSASLFRRWTQGSRIHIAFTLCNKCFVILSTLHVL